MKFIHYGSPNFDKSKFKEIKNQVFAWNKPMPKTGLWASPIDSSYGWADWCNEEGFRDCNTDNSFVFKLEDEVKILTINNESDLNKLPTIKNRIAGKGIDFEKLSKTYDAILLTEDGQWKTRHGYPLNLCGWDCESILIMNPNSIVEIK